jgi:hypothetical protein
MVSSEAPGWEWEKGVLRSGELGEEAAGHRHVNPSALAVERLDRRGGKNRRGADRWRLGG